MAKIEKEGSLQALNPALAKEWHPYKNAPLTPQRVSPRNLKKVWWVCRFGHEWECGIADRVRKNRGCPYCLIQKVKLKDSLIETHPHLAKEWHPTKNKWIGPGEVTADSFKVAWWLCPKGHTWRGIISMRTGSGLECPECLGKSDFLVFKK